jgi:alpha-galactosidase
MQIMNTTLHTIKSMKRIRLSLFAFLLLSQSPLLRAQNAGTTAPPMGWNSYGAFGATVKEGEVLENAAVMKAQLADFGWEYVVVGYCWYYPAPASMKDPKQREGFRPGFRIDSYGRLLPDAERFPSATKNKGFGPLADQIHSMGLKFGIHILRGIPRQAVAENLPVKGTRFRARDIADTSSICPWLNHMVGVDMNKAGAQEYYNSLFTLYASWGVDYVIVDDVTLPVNAAEISAIHKAVQQCGRPMILSLATGTLPDSQHAYPEQNSDTWTVNPGNRDNWLSLQQAFPALQPWEQSIAKGKFPDAGLLNLGQLALRGPVGEPRRSNLNRNELLTMMSLWSIARSPLMIGGDLRSLTSADMALLQNKAVLAVNRNSVSNRQYFCEKGFAAWTAADPETGDIYMAVFNLTDQNELVEVSLAGAGLPDQCHVTDLWSGDYLGVFHKAFRPEVPAHGARMLRIREE